MAGADTNPKPSSSLNLKTAPSPLKFDVRLTCCNGLDGRNFCPGPPTTAPPPAATPTPRSPASVPPPTVPEASPSPELEAALKVLAKGWLVGVVGAETCGGKSSSSSSSSSELSLILRRFPRAGVDVGAAAPPPFFCFPLFFLVTALAPEGEGGMEEEDVRGRDGGDPLDEEEVEEDGVRGREGEGERERKDAEDEIGEEAEEAW